MLLSTNDIWGKISLNQSKVFRIFMQSARAYSSETPVSFKHTISIIIPELARSCTPSLASKLHSVESNLIVSYLECCLMAWDLSVCSCGWPTQCISWGGWDLHHSKSSQGLGHKSSDVCAGRWYGCVSQRVGQQTASPEVDFLTHGMFLWCHHMPSQTMCHF